MRQAPPHNTSQAFLDRQREAKAKPAAKANGAHLNGASPLKMVEPVTLEGVAVPPRRWLVDGLVPLGNVTMLYGDGGLGKSLVAQQLATSCATGRDWIGQPVMRCRAIAFFCEDDADELHRRQADINDSYGVGFADLGDLQWQSRAGADSMLMTFTRDGYGKGKPTELLGQVRDAALTFGARLLILDSLHDLFGGNENIRGEVRSFIGALRGIAMAIDGAVMLCAHPSLSGLNTGSGSSGSTAWNNTIRSRLYLTRPKQDDDAEEDSDVRILRGMKANYAKTGGKIELTWRAGVFQAKQRPTGIFAKIEADRVLAIFLACLDAVTEQGRHVTDATNSPRSAAKVFAGMPQAEGATERDLKRAMDALFASGQIAMGEGRGADRHRIRCIVRANQEPTAGSAGSDVASL